MLAVCSLSIVLVTSGGLDGIDSPPYEDEISYEPYLPEEQDEDCSLISIRPKEYPGLRAASIERCSECCKQKGMNPRYDSHCKCDDPNQPQQIKFIPEMLNAVHV